MSVLSTLHDQWKQANGRLMGEPAPPRVVPSPPELPRTFKCALCSGTGRLAVPDTGCRPSLKVILEAVAAARGVEVEELLGPHQDQATSRIRHEFFYAAFKLTRHSKAGIGRFLAHRDHTTVINGLNRVTERRRAFPDYAADLDDLLSRIKELRS